MINYVREGDVVVTKLDRLGRSLSQCLQVLDTLKEKNVDFISLEQGIDTTKRDDPFAMAMIHLLGLFAEMERNFIVERTKSGKQAKIAAGNIKAKGGRPRVITKIDEEKLIYDITQGKSVSFFAKKFDISKRTIFRYKKRLK